MNRLIAAARVAIEDIPLYFYNPSTGTRFITLDSFAWLAKCPDSVFHKQLQELARYATQHNRFGHPEIDTFPPGCAFTRQTFATLNADKLPIADLRAAHQKLCDAYRQAVPEMLRKDGPEHIEWRNRMCSALTSQPNATAVEDLIHGISPEFYRQIEWLPGCRIENGKVFFDPVLEKSYVEPDDPELRAKNIIFNYLREYETVEYINIGQIGNSLSQRERMRATRTPVYIVQIKEVHKTEPELRILRFQAWGVKEHLDDGKDLLRAIMESRNYTDYVLDRRLGCRQLGMNLTERLTTGRISEVYHGRNQAYHGANFWSVYFERAYVTGCATDKIPHRQYANPKFNCGLAKLLGAAAAVNCIVGRANINKAVLFDDGDEVIVSDANGDPCRLTVADHTGSFMQYEDPLLSNAAAYAAPVNRRAALMPNAAEFALCYLLAFQQRFEQVKQEYLQNRDAFAALFSHRPWDVKGSFAYRWSRVLERLEHTDAIALTQAVRSHIEAPPAK
jgi:hypothetical protein